MRRSCLVVLLSLPFLLSNCAEKEPELVFAVGGAPSEVDYWQKILAEFADSTGIRVKVLRQPTDTDQRRQGLVIPLAAREKDPDVFLLDIAWIAQFAASGWLLPLDPGIAKDSFDLGAFFGPVLEQSDFYDGRTIALPVYIDCGLLYYRADLLKKYGQPVPETWEQLARSARVIQRGERKKDPRFHGFLWQGAQYEGLVCNFLEFIASAGGGFGTGNGRFTVTGDDNERALRFMSGLIHEYGISPPNTFTEMKEEEVRTHFQNGGALFERNWPYAWQLHNEEGSPVRGKVGVAVLPMFAGGRHAAALGGWHIAVSAYSDRKEQAWRLIRFILSYDIQKRFARDLGWNPGRRDVYADTNLLKKMPQAPVLKKAFEYAVARPKHPAYTQLSEIIQRHVNAAIAGKSDPAAALKRMQEEIDKMSGFYQ